MKKTKFTEAQIVFSLKQAESGVSVGEFGATDHPNLEIEDRVFRLELTSLSQ